MKKAIRILTTSLLLLTAPLITSHIDPTLFPTTVGAMDMIQDPNGFADLHWDETLQDVQASHQTKLARFISGTASYHILIPDAHGSVYFAGPVVACGVFMDNKLYAVIIPFSKELMQPRLEGMIKMWGKPDEQPGKDWYEWKGPFSIVSLSYWQGAKNASVMIFKNPKGIKNNKDAIKELEK